MKKSLLSLVAVAVAISGVASAQLLLSEVFDKSNGNPTVDTAYAQILNDYDGSRGYSDSSTISCDNYSNGVSITSPIIQYDALLDEPTLYRLFLSPYRVSQLKDGDYSVDTSKIISKEIKVNEKADDVTFDLSSPELDPETVYYGFIVPLDMYDAIGTPSKEVCFQINANVCMRDEACDALENVINPVQDEPVVEEVHGAAEDEHGASCVGMNLANVSHTVSNNVITLRWTAVDGDTVQIAVFDPNEEIYKPLGSVSMSDEKFNYTMQWNGEQNFMLTNGCKEVYYKADAAIKTPEPTIVPPATGTAENILYVAIAAIVLYGAYTIFTRKADNK